MITSWSKLSRQLDMRRAHTLLSKGSFLAFLVALGLLIGRAPLSLTVALLGGSGLFLGILVHPTLAIYLLAFAMPFGSLQELDLGGVNIGAVEALTGLVVVAWFARMVAQRKIQIHLAPLSIPLLLFLASLSVSLLFTLSLPLSLKEISKWIEVLVITLYLTNNAEGNKGHTLMRRLLIALLLAGSAQALLGLYQFWRRVGPEGFLLLGRFMRAHGTFRQPNPYAGYLGLHLPLALGVLFSDLEGLWGDCRRGNWMRRVLAWLALISAGLMALALLASWSRGGWLGFAAALVTMVLFLNRRAFLVALALGLLVGLVLLLGGTRYLPGAITERLTTSLAYLGKVDLRAIEITDANWSIVERLAHWQAGLEMFADHPWRGVGIGTYPVAYPQYALPRWQDPLGHAHNYVINLAAETGFIGLAGYAIFWAVYLVSTLRLLRRTHGLARGYVLAALGIFAHLHVHNLVDNLYVQGMHLQVAVALTLLYIARISATREATCGTAGESTCGSA
jgi:O-antigen ligase